MYEIINVAGADLIFSPFKNIETASLGVFLHVGSRVEKASTRGIAHFLEHMVFKGSKNYSCRRIKQEIEGRGGALNAFTSQEITGYYAHFLNKNLPKTLKIILDMVLFPLFNTADINKERRVILEEIKMYNDLPSSRVMVLLDHLLWKKHPLGQEIVGKASTVSKIRRFDLVDFKSKYYLPSNMVVSFSGDYSKRRIVELLNDKLIKTKRRINVKLLPPPATSGLQVKCEKKSIQQTHLCLGFRSLPYAHPKRLVAQLIHVILGANMSSRLFEELREKKSLCYDISTEVRRYKDSGAFVIHLGLDKEMIEVAILSILKELKKIKDKKVSGKELSRAKDYSLGHIAMALERPQGRMFYAANNYINLGRIKSFDQIRKKVQAITAEEVQALSNKIFKFKDLCVSCVGNIEPDFEPKIKEIIKKGGYYS